MSGEGGVGAREGAGRRILRSWWVLPATIAVMLTLLAGWSGGGVAGTDEYWYVGDLRMTGAVGRAVSNHVFPCSQRGWHRARSPRGCTTRR